jgi:hypothetical protein
MSEKRGVLGFVAEQGRPTSSRAHTIEVAHRWAFSARASNRLFPASSEKSARALQPGIQAESPVHRSADVGAGVAK